MSRVGEDADLQTIHVTVRSSADLRAAKTRRAILDAVGRFTARGFTSIATSDAVRRARVSRSWRHGHLSGLDELAAGIGYRRLATRPSGTWREVH